MLYLTMYRGTRLLHKLEKHGIQGYILKDAAIEELKKAILTVASGKVYFSSEIVSEGKSIERNTVTTPDNKLKELLSPREYEIVKLVCKEYSNVQIAEKLFISVSTVETHRKNVISKLGVNNTVGLVKFAIKNNLL